jgi:hypothetical protein
MSRPKKTGSEIPHVAGSMKAASAMWNLSITEIKRAKRSGCTAFAGTKVYRDELVKWLTMNPPKAISSGAGDTPIDDANKEELERRKLIRQVTRLDVGIQADKFKLDAIKEKYILRQSVSVEWTRLWSIVEEETKGLMDKAVYPVWVARIKARIK